MTALKDDNRRLNQSVSELRSERRLQERKMRDLQHQLDQVRAQAVVATVDGSMPQLRTEVANPEHPATPDGQRVVGVTDSGEEIVYEGDAADGRPAAPIGERDEPQVTVAPPPRRADKPLPPVPTTSDRIEVTRRAARAPRTTVRERDGAGDRNDAAGSDYRAAVELVKSGQYDQAVGALRAFIQKYPRHDYADNAQYWIGEAHYARKEYAQALVEFRAVVEVYPRGNKVPDALLKVGYCYQAMGQTDKARAVLEQVVSLYPKTEPAALAAKRLESK
jgi:tol-pal system protein YbgF